MRLVGLKGLILTLLLLFQEASVVEASIHSSFPTSFLETSTARQAGRLRRLEFGEFWAKHGLSFVFAQLITTSTLENKCDVSKSMVRTSARSGGLLALIVVWRLSRGKHMTEQAHHLDVSSSL